MLSKLQEYMEIEKRALYNLLRMNWLNDSSDDEPQQWQIDDYRTLPIKTLFSRLQKLGIAIDQNAFLAYSEDVESPEELTEFFLDDINLEAIEQDQAYLLVFELWRRLLPERLCLSIFCDELDHQIHLYDRGDLSSAETIQDSIANLQMIMDENVDQGVDPVDIMKTVSEGCANNLETFFYDYISEQIDEGHLPYAEELVEGFGRYFKANKWFELLKIRITAAFDSEASHEDLRKIVQKAAKDEDLSFNLEILSIIVQVGEKGEFNKIVRKTIPLLKTEEDFLDLLFICSDYYRCLDEDQKEQNIQEIIANRQTKILENPLNPSDQEVAKLLKILR